MSMFSFQAIHNDSVGKKLLCNVVYRLCQCSLFKQFTTTVWSFVFIVLLFIDYVNVLFSSNSQPLVIPFEEKVSCLSIMSMFSFQAIHNSERVAESHDAVVYRLCQCSLFKQFTTRLWFKYVDDVLFIDYVNVLFSSNSQPCSSVCSAKVSCLSIMSMFSFQAIHNLMIAVIFITMLFIDYVNVLFSSNSQHLLLTLHKHQVVYRLCQCSLFKQFTTHNQSCIPLVKLFIDYVNVLFSSNSQHVVTNNCVVYCCLSIMSMFSFQAIHNYQMQVW